MSNAISSGSLTASGIVSTFRTAVSGVIVNADGTNAATVNIYDGQSTGGTKIMTVAVKAGDVFTQVFPKKSIQSTNGIYAEIIGTGASAYVYHGA